ncbi:MAG TPA: transporter, partial [Actinobacteria bacterium]|nr:transporter [Actinomycetota bacterium]
MLALLATGLVAGTVSTVVSLASVVSYPALLAIGLPPLSANMTNTVSLLFTGVGAAAGSRPELAGQGARVRRLGLITALGGAAGATLLLLTPPQTFARAAPILIGV